MKKLLELRQQKAALKTQMRSMLEKADSEKRSLNDEEGKQFDELRAQADALEVEITSLAVRFNIWKPCLMRLRVKRSWQSGTLSAVTLSWITLLACVPAPTTSPNLAFPLRSSGRSHLRPCLLPLIQAGKCGTVHCSPNIFNCAVLVTTADAGLT